MNEIDWIKTLKLKVKKSKEVLVGIGDDCAVVNFKKGNYLLKSDLFIEGTHFKRSDISLKDISMRAIARVISDFAACGGLPLYIGISLGVPSKFSKKQLNELLKGVLMMSKRYSFSLIGGDTSRSNKLFFDVWGIGRAKKYILRSSAKIGDYIFVSGRIGEKKFNRPFEPRLKESQYLVNNFKVNSMIDITDGFVIDLHRIIEESKKGAIIFKEALPLSSGLNDLYRGEDYELLFTIDKSEKNISKLKSKFYYVGKITSLKQGLRIKDAKSIKKLTVKGYLHF